MLLRAPLPPNAIFVLIFNPKMKLGVYSQQIWTTWFAFILWTTLLNHQMDNFAKMDKFAVDNILPNWTILLWHKNGFQNTKNILTVRIRKAFFWQYKKHRKTFWRFNNRSPYKTKISWCFVCCLAQNKLGQEKTAEQEWKTLMSHCQKSKQNTPKAKQKWNRSGLFVTTQR